MPALPCIDIEPRTAANATVILLHGLGADGNDFVPMVAELQPAGRPAGAVYLSQRSFHSRHHQRRLYDAGMV